ncbi:MAG TPA: hypothetical protein VEU31_04435 [Candidatus Acidoferrales bacterium]|nr:hypothetical protein [Candidatus Acidoferrales bacterium]
MLHKKPFALAVILIHLAVNVVHGLAHNSLRITLTRTQQVFVLTVILAAPLLAGILLLIKAHRAGALLLLFSMAGSLLFGGYNHFVAIGADNALYVASGPWSMAFQVTSALLIVTEFLGCWAGFAMLRQPPQ